MSAPKIRNVHQRRITADPEVVWGLLMAMPGPDGQLWPPGIPTMRFDGPMQLGADGRHGPIHYTVTTLDATGGDLVFGFRDPTGLAGHHSFHVRPDGRTGTWLRHEVIADPTGWMQLAWPLAIRWVHDAVVEEIMDRAEVAAGTGPAQPYRRSPWVKCLLAAGTLGRAATRDVGPPSATAPTPQSA